MEEEYWRCLPQIESKAKSAHAKLKRQFHLSQLNFERSWALSVIVCELERLEIDGVDALSCVCAIRRTHQLPCAHEIVEYSDRGVPIPLDVVHSHWRKLDLINIGNSSHGTTSPGKSQLQIFNMWYEQQDDEKKRQVHITLEELMNPSSPSKVKLKTKGRPRKVNTSTRRLPFAFEIAEASTASSKNKPKQSLTASLKINQRRVPLQCQRKETWLLLVPYCLIQKNLRTIATSMGFGHNEWCRVRKELLQQLHNMSSVFKKCIREHKRCNKIELALNYFGDGFAPFFCWMTMPDMGHIIATCYNVVLIILSMRQCLTFLPFSVQSRETKLREIAIGFVDDDHYVQVHLSPDHHIPSVSRMWHEKSSICNVTHLYSRYQARVDAFQQLPGVENVATIDMVILKTDQNAPTIDLRL
ncbi:unnamed protein product [Prunus armeniaca]